MQAEPCGWRGRTCKQFYCEEECKNGGTCIGANSCRCVEGFTRTPVCDSDTWCGDNLRQADEDCDDGNDVADDGCSVECMWEEGVSEEVRAAIVATQ